MFCPKCGIRNRIDQKFCRGCGHALGGHRVALENNYGDVVERIKSGSAVVGLSAVGFIVISLMALAVWLSQNDAGVFFTLIPVLAFCIPGTILGLVRLHRAHRVLSATSGGSDRKAVEQSETVPYQLAAGALTDPLTRVAQAPASITEHTTHNLDSSSQVSDEPRTGRQVDSPSSAS